MNTAAGEPADPTGVGGLTRYRLDISYDGTDFKGWARQPNLRTVCGELEQALSTVLRQPVPLTVAGRTDAGVHATGQVAHMDLADPVAEGASAVDPIRLVRRLGRLLPPDVRVRRITEAPADFDARFSALRRHYRYRISTAPYGPEPLQARQVVGWSFPIDEELLGRASARLTGLHDFAAFCRRREGATTVRDLQTFEWHREGDLLSARVVADAFCWSMVRSLVGSVLTVAQGRRPVDWIDDLLTMRERAGAIPVVAAKGLTLVAVDYPDAVALAERNRVTRDLRTAVSGPGCC